MTAIIIEDEQSSQEVLRSAINQFTTGIEIVGDAADVQSGIELIRSTTPDLVFLDIDLPDGTGFTILDNTLDFNFKVIFVTAYDSFAIKAIRYAAFDYLLKPLDLDDLTRALDRIKLKALPSQQNLQLLKENMNVRSEDLKSIMIPLLNGYTVITLDHIIAVKANANYVTFVLEDGKQHIASHTLSYYEDLLPEDTFFRLHKSHLINLNKVTSFEKGRGGKVCLKNGEFYEIALRRKATFKVLIKKMGLEME